MGNAKEDFFQESSKQFCNPELIIQIRMLILLRVPDFQISLFYL